jgi:hypothetical protein
MGELRGTPSPENESSPLPTLCPNDHLRLIVELMREGGMELTRRWVAALVMVAPEDREELVSAIEHRVAAAYDSPERGGIEPIHVPTAPAPESATMKPGSAKKPAKPTKKPSRKTAKR